MSSGPALFRVGGEHLSGTWDQDISGAAPMQDGPGRITRSVCFRAVPTDQDPLRLHPESSCREAAILKSRECQLPPGRKQLDVQCATVGSEDPAELSQRDGARTVLPSFDGHHTSGPLNRTLDAERHHLRETCFPTKVSEVIEGRSTSNLLGCGRFRSQRSCRKKILNHPSSRRSPNRRY